MAVLKKHSQFLQSFIPDICKDMFTLHYSKRVHTFYYILPTASLHKCTRQVSYLIFHKRKVGRDMLYFSMLHQRSKKKKVVFCIFI